MRYQRIIPAIIIGMLYLLVGCNSNGVDHKSHTYQNRIVMITYENKSGLNLLENSTSGHYRHKDVKIYFMKNGKKLTKKESKTGTGKIEKANVGSNPHYILSILTPQRHKPKEGITTTLIELQQGETDTLKTHYKTGNNHFIIDKAWYNGELKWTGNPGGNVFFTVHKEGRTDNPTP